jgi:thioredoxin-disulfide reductase
MENIYDLIIIGTGPAGLTAAIFARRREMKTLLIGRDIGGQLIWASKIENYPGFNSIKSPELANKMFEQAIALGAEFKNSEVKEIKKENDNFIVLSGQDVFVGKTVILALGLSPRKLNIPGEKEFSGKGVSYCANCDGPFFKDKIVAVVGGGNAALDAAEVMSKIAKQVYLIQHNRSFTAFEALVDEVKNRKNINIYLDNDVVEVGGADKVKKIKIQNHKNGDIKELAVDGVFIEIGREAKTELIQKIVKTDQSNQIIVNDCCATSAFGLFAAGDVTQTPFKQITIACGQGTTAALAAYQYLQLKSHKDCQICCPKEEK